MAFQSARIPTVPSCSHPDCKHLTFTSAHTLQLHIRTHKELMFFCQECKIGFNDENDYLSHRYLPVHIENVKRRRIGNNNNLVYCSNFFCSETHSFQP